MATQKDQVLNHIIRRGSITPMAAFKHYQITTLAERIRDLRDSGHKIATEMVNKGGKRFARYRLVA